ncbi:MAG: SHOCT domain-containing protein [Trueperaceae bacterium]|nr:SHOCT domain-containing protein [Trueperaceae bacterium]
MIAMMMYPFGMAWGGVGGVLWLLLLLGLTVAAAVAVARYILPTSSASSRADPALDTLRTRFANGEIDEEEYRHRRAALTRSHQGGPA